MSFPIPRDKPEREEEIEIIPEATIKVNFEWYLDTIDFLKNLSENNSKETAKELLVRIQ
jgi:hypothetical protein